MLYIFIKISVKLYTYIKGIAYTMNRWTVVHFIEEETVEAVPTSWVHGETCYWPPFIGSKLTHSINNCETPILSTWTLHKIRELGDGRTYSNYFYIIVE